MKARISRKFFCLLLAVVMVCTLLPIAALADGPSGSIESAVITHDNGVLKNAVSVELKGVTFTKSVAVELYSGDTRLTTATLNTDKLGAGSYQILTCCIATQAADEYWPLTPWTPKDDVVPNKAVLVVDGHKLDEKTFTLNADEWAALPGTAFPSSGSIESAVITHDNGVLKNAVSVELKGVTFTKSVAVELYSGDTRLTTATLNTDKLGAGSYQILTCCIATQAADEYWPLTPWTPKDDVVPNKAVLVVDGHKLDEKTFTLNADEWAALPGTAFPSSGSINGAVITQNAVSVELENVKFESSVQVKLYSGDTLLTTAKLNTDKLGAGSYQILTCCIATQAADEYWPLTPWTPKDDVVPNKAVLVVDGHKLDEKTFTLNADEWAALPGTAFPSSGSINGAVITQNAVSVELENVKFESSVQVKLYSGDTLLTTAKLNTGKLGAGSYPYLTCCIATKTADEYWALTPWTPKDDVVPDKAVLFVDGHKLDEKTFTLNGGDWADLPGTVLPYSGSIERVGITHDNGVLKNAVSVDLKNVTFKTSVQVELYSGDTLLTTATLQGVNPGSYGFLTCCIATETADANWALAPWTPKDDVVPDKAVLFVDGHKLDEKTFTLNGGDWADLPGTVLPYSGSIERVGITHDNGVLKNAVSVDLKNVTFKTSVQVELYSGDTLLTTATLQGVNPGSYGFLTCCIATETADANWALAPWTPKDDVVPDKAVLFVDGHKLDEKTFTLNGGDWADLPGTVLPYSGSIERVGITHDNGVLKNAVSVDLKNVTFKTSVQVELYSGDTLLTTATLQGVNPGSYGFLTCCIATETADANWALAPWTPKDDVVPDKAVLFVDGHKLDEKTFTLNGGDWADLPGTVLPYSGSIERVGITHDNGVLKNAVSVDLKNVTFKTSVQVKLYRGKTLLTTATLNTDKLGTGSYPYLTCCIATETADEYWALTPWTPKDNVVPNKVVLFVDDNEMDTMKFTLDAAEWKALPGTVRPSNYVTNGAATENKPSPKTFDAGIAMYVGMALISVAGSAVVIGKKKEF